MRTYVMTTMMEHGLSKVNTRRLCKQCGLRIWVGPNNGKHWNYSTHRDQTYMNERIIYTNVCLYSTQTSSICICLKLNYLLLCRLIALDSPSLVRCVFFPEHLFDVWFAHIHSIPIPFLVFGSKQPATKQSAS